MALAATAYRQRRKMLRVTLGPVVGLEAMAAAGIDPTERPERLDIGQWARLAEVVHGAQR
jgi:16S rRNA A1518/A1519 N6-dimethyltransferase RsmA/KsgA/DIM1 with predicted DNA glycosylase/AP lyase activity